MKGSEWDGQESQAQRDRQEVLVAAQFARRKVKGALTELREALTSLDKILERMLER